MRTLSLAASIAIVCSPLAGWTSANAADFAHAKRTYVPATSFDRRVDFTTVRDYQAVSSSVPASARGSVKYSVAPRSSSSPKVASVPPPPSYSADSMAKAAKNVQTQLKKAAQSPQVQSAVAALRKKAAELAASGKFDEAKQMAARVLAMSPQDKLVLKNMATSTLDRAKQFVQSADFDKALQYGREALAYDGGNTEAKKVVDAMLVKAGINPADAEQRLKNGDLLLTQGKNDEAFVEYQTSLKLKPSADAHVGIGNVAVRSGQKEHAKTQYHAAIDVDSNSSAAYRQLGLLKLNQGDIVGANAALSRALVLNPKDKHASKSLVELWQQQVSKVPGANSHLGLARAYQLSGDLQSAQAQYRTVVQLDPMNPHLPAARQSFKLALARQEAEKATEAGRTLEAHGAISDAYQKVHEAVRLAPGDADLRVYQGQLLEKLQRVPAARDAYLNALKINPHNSVAAERLKHLPPDAVADAPSISMPPTQMLAAPAAVSAATSGVATATGIPAAPTHDPVANISNFAQALRNQMLVSKTQMEQVEEATHAALKQIGAPPPATDALTTTTMASASDATSGIDSSLTSSVNDALSAAAAAIAAAKGKAPAAATTDAAPAVAATVPDTTPKAIANTQKLLQQNQELQTQLKKMKDAMAKLKGQPAQAQPAAAGAVASNDTISTTTTPVYLPPTTTPNPELDSILGTNSNAGNMALQAASLPPLAPPITRSNGLQALTPEVDPSAATSNNFQEVALKQPMALPTLVRLELENTNPKAGAVELSVILRNDGDSSLPLASNKMKAVINYANRRPAEVKAQFTDIAVPPHGAIRGLIRVPFDKVDPSADLVIPELLPAGSPARDVHLITSMAFR